MVKTFFLLPFVLLLPQCSSSSGTAEVPILASPARAQAWGSPGVTRTKKGYTMTYQNPSNSKERLVIKGSQKSFFFTLYPPNLIGTRIVNGTPTKISEAQLWQKSLVLGQTVKWYQRTLPTEQNGALFRSLGTELKTSDGRTASYRFEVEGTKNQMQSWLSELRFAP